MAESKCAKCANAKCKCKCEMQMRNVQMAKSKCAAKAEVAVACRCEPPQTSATTRQTILRRKSFFKLMITENTKYALRVANPRVADRPAGALAARRAYRYVPLMTL
jgi:hypothetical protein